MEINKQKFSLAAVVTTGVVYLICTVFTSLFPEITMRLLGWVIHPVNVEKFASGIEVTVGSFFAGLLQILFYTYLAAYLFTSIYNKLLKRQ